MFIEPRVPRYQWGQSVCAATDLYNDGSLPGADDDQLLIAAGGPGEIVQIGHHQEANAPLYMVDFGLCVLGCLEEELVRDDAAAAVASAVAATVTTTAGAPARPAPGPQTAGAPA